MDNLTKEINKRFNNKYEFLRLWSVVYDKSMLCCKLIFLFPESISEIDDTMRKELEQFVTDYLKLNAKIILSFKKSFLYEELIQKSAISFLEKNYFSVFSGIKDNDVVIVKNNESVDVKLNLLKELYDYFKENQIDLHLKNFLEKIYYSNFNIISLKLESVSDEILESRKYELVKVPEINKTKRYQVLNPVMLLGKEIAPMPELICEQKQEKSSLIIAGVIKNLVKKPFKSRRNKNKDVENHYYSFDINDTTSTLNAIHFASKSNEPKLDKLTEGMAYLFVGDLRKNNYDKLTYYIRSISMCNFDEELVKNAMKSTVEKVKLASTYQNVFPKKYISTLQESLFSDNNVYNELITDNEIVVFDVETTGLEPDVCEIIEIGAIKIVNGKLTEIFQTLVKPKKEIPQIITEITGIDNNMVADALDIKKVLADFIVFSKNCILSGYNVSFDMRFLQNAGKELNYHFDNRVEDAMAYAKNKLFLGNYTLKNVAKNLGVSLKEAHRALNDAIATAKVLLELNKNS